MFPILVAQLPHTNSSCLTLQWLSIVFGFYCRTRPGLEGLEGDGNNESRAGEVTAAVITMRVFWSTGHLPHHLHHQLSMKGGCSPLSANTNNISYLENISMEFHCGTDNTRISLRSWSQCQHIFSLPAKCYRKLSAQSKTQTGPASIEERFLYKSHFWKWTLERRVKIR